MEKGRIIFLNGVTSSGKTSIVEALQERDDVFFYVVANDLFQEIVGDKYLRENYWKYLSEAIIMMYHTAKLYSDMGKKCAYRRHTGLTRGNKTPLYSAYGNT